ncbi:MAG: exodeoxyribonuclease V subunit gamma [Clostridia bacterium]|nr:exodeoxyribonuclease V subunit gamma [Clostridia bacterium]
MIKLLTTNSYFNLFTLLIKNIDGVNAVGGKNIVFCEEKVSLMAERMLCAETGGSFNTDVYSFGNFLRTKKQVDNVLSKEGSAMAVKRILSSCNLKCFKASKTTLAPTLYELIMQLKSAKVLPSDIAVAADGVDGILKSKLQDVAEIYSRYEEFIKENGYEDQSSILTYLPTIIEDSDLICSANVYLVGFSGFTAQIRAVIDKLIDKAKSVTAILCEGENPLVFVNETATFIRRVAKEKGVAILEERYDSGYSTAGRVIVDNLFYPSKKESRAITEKGNVHLYAAPSGAKEVERVGQVIKRLVMHGACRYRDITIALPDIGGYREYIKSSFNALGIPFFLDERKKPDNHPLITLILSYIDAYRKNFERNALTAFFKNPLYSADKEFTDEFSKYLIKYNINYGRIREPFTFSTDGKYDLNDFEEFRKTLCDFSERFDVRGMIDKLLVKEKIDGFTERLKAVGESEEAAVNVQIYEKVIKILDEMQMLLSGVKMSVAEYKAVFLSGVAALELSIIPQYNDAVFIGGYKATALAKADYLFAMGLTADVPNVRSDVALLSDGDIDALEKIKVMVEPKIKVVNHRTRENVALALAAFNKKLFLSYPVSAVDGKKNEKSEVVTSISSLIEFDKFPEEHGYLTFKQGLKTFAKESGEFYDGIRADFSDASTFYATDQTGTAKEMVERANRKIQITLDRKVDGLLGKETSPTTIEDYYKCPYRAFLAHVLRLENQDDGSVSVLSVGNLMHEIFRRYANEMDKVTDERSSDQLFDKIKDKILEREEYKRFLSDGANRAAVSRVVRESKKYCYETFNSLKDSSFKVSKTEASFGDGKDYPAISLNGGAVKLKGKIDRVDESDSYFRVLDYKTGKADAADKALFAGLKLQLYLYAAAVKGKYPDGEKQPAGLYYLPVADKYEKHDDKKKCMAVGKTLGDKDALLSQDKLIEVNGESLFVPVKKDKNGKFKNVTDGQTLSAYIDYAVEISSLAAKRMTDGVIVPSPFEGVCDYCEFKSLCGGLGVERSLGKVCEKTITDAKKGGGENG